MSYVRLLGLPFSLLPRDRPLPVWFGPRRGLRWILASSVRSCLAGVYERRKTRQLQALLKPGGVFYDIGAQAGYHALLASRLVGRGGAVFAFEPLPRNLGFLRRHLEINAADNVAVVGAALSDQDGEVGFDLGPGFMGGHISPEAPLRVKCYRLDSWAAREGARPPTVIKIDVEGAEYDVLTGARHTLTEARPAVLLDAHDFLGGPLAGLHSRCLEFLTGLGYHVSVDYPRGPGQAIEITALSTSSR